jgi:tetratricopeptide (TPR) repeat protein
MCRNASITIKRRLEDWGMRARRSLGFMLALFCVTAGTQSAAADVFIAVRNNNNLSVRACVDALQRNKPVLGPAFANRKINIIALSDLEERDAVNWNATPAPIAIKLDDRANKFDLISVPFAFRDAKHFQAFLESELYNEVLDAPLGGYNNTRLAIAYGGFYQIFSYAAAVTEAKHFHARYVGGAIVAVSTYQQLGALVNPGSIMATPDDIVQRDGEVMRQGQQAHPTVHMVEATLTSAIRNNLHKNARFVNLMSAALMPLTFQGYNLPKQLSETDKNAIKKWAGISATECSAVNYQSELDALRDLAAAGLTVVPFNRQPVVEASWSASLTRNHTAWTVEQFDRLAKLGESKPVTLPSTLLSKLPPEERMKARKWDEEAIAEIRKRQGLDLDYLDVDGQVAVLTERIKKNKNDFDSLVERGHRYAQQARFVLALHPDKRKQALQLTARALDDLNAVVKAQPRNVNALINRGYTYEIAGETEKAIADFQAAARINPELKQGVEEHIKQMRSKQ